MKRKKNDEGSRMKKLKTVRGKGGRLTQATIKGLHLKPVTHPNGEPYVCMVCGTGLFWRKRAYRYYGNRVVQRAGWCPICIKFRDASTRILQSQYYEGMRGRRKYA